VDSLNRTLTALFITMSLIEIGYGMVLALLPVYLAEYLGIGIKYIGIIIAMFSFSELIAKAPGGWLADRIGRKPVLLVGIGLITLSFFSYHYSQESTCFFTYCRFKRYWHVGNLAHDGSNYC